MHPAINHFFDELACLEEGRLREIAHDNLQLFHSFGISALIDEEAGRVQVPVHDSVFVALVDGCERVADVLSRFVFVLDAVSYELVEKRAMTVVVLDQVEALIALVVAVQLNEVVVLDVEQGVQLGAHFAVIFARHSTLVEYLDLQVGLGFIALDAGFRQTYSLFAAAVLVDQFAEGVQSIEFLLASELVILYALERDRFLQQWLVLFDVVHLDFDLSKLGQL